MLLSVTIIDECRSEAEVHRSTIEDSIMGSFLIEAAQTEVNEAGSKDVRAGFYQDILHLDVPVEDVFGLKFCCCFNQLLQYHLKQRQRGRER